MDNKKYQFKLYIRKENRFIWTLIEYCRKNGVPPSVMICEIVREYFRKKNVRTKTTLISRSMTLGEEYRCIFYHLINSNNIENPIKT